MLWGILVVLAVVWLLATALKLLSGLLHLAFVAALIYVGYRMVTSRKRP